MVFGFLNRHYKHHDDLHRKKTFHVPNFLKFLNHLYLKNKWNVSKFGYAHTWQKGGGEGGWPPLSHRSPTLVPPLGLKNCPPPLELKKLDCTPPEHFEYPYPWTPPRRPRPKKIFCRSAANLSYIFGNPNIRSHGNYPKNIKNWKKKSYLGNYPPPFLI